MNIENIIIFYGSSIYKNSNAQKKCHFANIQLISARFFFLVPPQAPGRHLVSGTKIAYEV